MNESPCPHSTLRATAYAPGVYICSTDSNPECHAVFTVTPIDPGPNELRPAQEWAASEGVVIRDPDGWRTDNLPLGTPIAYREYLRRVTTSTVERLR